MISSARIRERLAEVLADDLSIEDFDEWLLDYSWNMHKDSPDEARALAGRLGIHLWEYSQGHRSEAELRRLFAELAVDPLAHFIFALVASRCGDHFAMSMAPVEVAIACPPQVIGRYPSPARAQCELELPIAVRA